jgi:ABC-type iron transport system FetAB ATPase subunit
MDGLSLVDLSFLGNGPYSLSIQPGECVGVTGSSGVGKTQLLRAVADVIPHKGDCFLSGTSCQAFAPEEWRTMVAMVPAESFWWYDLVGAHFNSNSGHDDPVVLLEKLGFSSDVMNWQISRLSTGERQRLALVRTLITRPKVLLLDEPTASLDKKMVHVVEELLARRFAHGYTSCIWVSHDLEQLSRVAERVFRVEPEGLLQEEN